MSLTTVAPAPPQTRAPVGPRDAAALAAELRRTVRGEVRFDAGSRALYATDASNYRQVPIGVVIPRDKDDVVATVAAARTFGAPVLSRGGGTSLAGQCCNVAVLMDFSKYLHHVLEVDPERKQARVEPGCVLDRLRDAAEQHHLTFGPDPATHDHCTLGGMLGNNSCGMHAQMAGKCSENVLELEVLTYAGERMWVGPTSEDELARIIRAGGRRGELYAGMRALRDRYADLIRQRFPKIPRRVSGYNLDALLPENGFNVASALVGSESTLVTILEARLKLVHSPPVRSLLVLGYPDIYTAADHVPDVLAHSQPIALEGLDDQLIADMKAHHIHPREADLLPPGAGWLMIEYGGESKDEADAQARALMAALKGNGASPPTMKLFDDPGEEKLLWEVREAALGATANVPGQSLNWPGWEDSAVAPERLGDYLRDLRGLYNKYGYRGDFYGHFGQGCLHVRTSFDLETRPGIAAYRRFAHEAAELVVRYGGSLSGEHGDGQARGELLPIMFGAEGVQAFREFKRLWDPDGQMNPGKVIDADPLDAHLRLGADYAPPHPKIHFGLPEDNGDFARATLRCVGVGKCRREHGGTMCPSYMVTHEEQHSTRGRARLLFEMLEGDPVGEGWRSQAVFDALDLCLACKGCKGDCPVKTDMATYKAEFLSHYYAGRLRPRSAYAFGLIMYWARLAERAPGLVNFVTQTPGVRALARWAAGVAPARTIPAFAPETFRQWWARREAPPRAGTRVILWPDTFNDHFHPATAQAAVQVLEAAGCAVELPRGWLCCGRPLYDYGFLDLAKHQLKQILDDLRPEIRAGVPIVGLEPSCVAVFRDELGNLFPYDEDAKRLATQTHTLSEFLLAQGWRPPTALRGRKAIVQGHCHHRAIMGFQPEQQVLAQLGLDLDVPDSGCCGMAGAFGFEAGEHYDVSVRAGERVILPAVRATPDDALVIADGFSCREQIRQGTGRQPLHLAEVIALALGEQAGAAPVEAAARQRSSKQLALLATAGTVLAGAAYAVRRARK